MPYNKIFDNIFVTNNFITNKVITNIAPSTFSPPKGSLFLLPLAPSEKMRKFEG